MERFFYNDNELVVGEKHLTQTQLATKVPGICDPNKFKSPSASVIFQCLHGVGHALMYTLGYDLTAALGSCNYLSTNYEQQSCYGGVFMENITAFDKSKRNMRLADPLYPCDKALVGEQQACYLIQTSMMLEIGIDYPHIAQDCLTASPDSNIQTCFISMGRDLSNYVRTGDGSLTVKGCEQWSGKYVNYCLQGAIYSLVENTQNGQFAYKYCEELSLAKNQTECFILTNDYLRSFFKLPQSQIVLDCDKYTSSLTEVCKHW